MKNNNHKEKINFRSHFTKKNASSLSGHETFAKFKICSSTNASHTTKSQRCNCQKETINKLSVLAEKQDIPEI